MKKLRVLFIIASMTMFFGGCSDKVDESCYVNNNIADNTDDTNNNTSVSDNTDDTNNNTSVSDNTDDTNNNTSVSNNTDDTNNNTSVSNNTDDTNNNTSVSNNTDNGSNDNVSVNTQDSNSKIENLQLISPREKTIDFNQVTLEVSGNISDVIASVDSNEYKGIKNGSSFFIYNVDLKSGENEIELIANGGQDRKKIKISSEGKGIPPIRVNSDKREGFEKLKANLKVYTELSTSEYLLDRNSDGIIDENKSDNSFSVNYKDEGRYFPRVTIKTSAGTLYTSQKVLSLDVKAKPTEAKIVTVSEKINDLERFGDYIWALSNTKIYRIDNSNKIETIGLSGVSNPQGFTIDSNGDIIIADTGNNKIIKLSKSSNYSKIFEFGMAGDSNGELQEPKDVTVSGIGETQNIYVLDSGNRRIQIFNSSGVYLNKIDKTNSSLGFNNTQNIIGSSTITLFDNSKIQEIGLTVSNTVSKFVITDKFSNISKIGESSNGIVFFDKSKNQIVFLYSNGKVINSFDTKSSFNILIAFDKNSKIYGATENGGIEKINISLDPKGAKPIDIAKKFVDSFLKDDNSTMSLLMHSSNKYERLYERETIAKAVFSAIQLYSEKINNDFATVTAIYKTKDENGEIQFNLVRSAGQMESTNDWFIIDIY